MQLFVLLFTGLSVPFRPAPAFPARQPARARRADAGFPQLLPFSRRDGIGLFCAPHLAPTSRPLDPSPLASLRLRSEKRECQVSLLSWGVRRPPWAESGALGQPCIPLTCLELEENLGGGGFAFGTLPCLFLPLSDLEFLLPQVRVASCLCHTCSECRGHRSEPGRQSGSVRACVLSKGGGQERKEQEIGSNTQDAHLLYVYAFSNRSLPRHAASSDRVCKKLPELER